jgi:hypothetical protein
MWLNRGGVPMYLNHTLAVVGDWVVCHRRGVERVFRVGLLKRSGGDPSGPASTPR